MSDSIEKTDLTTLEDKVAAVLADLATSNPEVHAVLVRGVAADQQIEHIEKSFNERADKVFQAAIRLVMTASGRKNLIITEDNMSTAETTNLEITEIGGNVKYSIK
ncbi:hypothetical protein JT321_gp65 [Providencia phage Kokobel1]|uniref:Uncharacterized protein n=1 Tax=Providencia phage Kokobel1 TaxID=2783540 RepID=A0A873WG63_9CAUD|nr:hypothetical protein JT321_gp65 [Providencia phage Kokobel1]QPB11492.1 hypothetical protein [Providencia phage Kokobel1]